MYLEQILFCANNTDYKIELEKPIMAHSYDEMRKYAKKEVERYMFDNGIPGPYKLYLLWMNWLKSLLRRARGSIFYILLACMMFQT